jgi:GNAT superfamily N-acetyltransferase
MNIDLIHRELTTSYWSPGISREIVAQAMKNSICFAGFHVSDLIAFSRIITDRATFAYLSDVFIVEHFRGIGIGKELIAEIMEHPDLQTLRRFMLATRDAHGFYKQFGFMPLRDPEIFMQITKIDIYRQ